MVRAVPGRVVAVVRRDDQQFVVVDFRQELAQFLVEGFQAVGIALDVAAMAVHAVEVDEVGHEQALILAMGCQLGPQGFHVFVVVGRVVRFGQADVSVDVADLADADDGITRFDK